MFLFSFLLHDLVILKQKSKQAFGGLVDPFLLVRKAWKQLHLEPQL
jgi:hypothetical protein